MATDYRSTALKKVHDRAVLDGALRDRSGESLTDLVARAREAGALWREIGEALGVTRQAAMTRFKAKIAEKV